MGMYKPVFKDEFKPMTAKEKKKLDALLKDLRQANKNPKFKEFVERLKAYHLGLD